MKKDYKQLEKEVHSFYLGDIDEDDFKSFYQNWMKRYGMELPKRIRLLDDMLCNSIDEEVSIVNETDGEVYYYDGCRRYCYLNKSDEGKFWVWA